jgi:hypothetical protein
VTSRRPSETTHIPAPKLAKLLGLSPGWLAVLRWQKRGPSYVHRSAGRVLRVYYSIFSVLRWLEKTGKPIPAELMALFFGQAVRS